MSVMSNYYNVKFHLSGLLMKFENSLIRAEGEDSTRKRHRVQPCAVASGGVNMAPLSQIVARKGA